MIKRLILIFILLCNVNAFSQEAEVVLNEVEAVWDQGVPVCPDDPYISKLIEQLGFESIRDGQIKTLEEKKIYCEIGLAFYARKQYDAADWYLAKSIAPIEQLEMLNAKVSAQTFELGRIDSRVSVIKEIAHVGEKPATIIKTVIMEKEASVEELEGMKKDAAFLNSLPKSLDGLSKKDLAQLARQIDEQIKKLVIEKDSLVKAKATKQAISAKEGTISILKSEKEVIDLNIKNSDLSGKNKLLNLTKEQYTKYLTWAGIALALLCLLIFILSQRKTIKAKDLKILGQLKDIIKKNVYLEHAAKLIRHDMHSGINTYIPRGISSLEKRLSAEEAKNLKIDTSIKMIKEGLMHTQKVYKSVYEFTNLVKQQIVLEKQNFNLKELLTNYLLSTSYNSQVEIAELVEASVNGTLFCNAIDNLIRNGLKYNTSEDKKIQVYMEEDFLVVEDNGVGMSPDDFEKNINKIEADAGIGLGISASILNEHGFAMECERIESGTKIKIKIK